MKPPAPVKARLTRAQRKEEELRVKALASPHVKGTAKGPLETGGASSENKESSTGKPQRSTSRSKRTQEQIATLKLGAEKKLKKAATQTRKVTAQAW